MSEEEGKAIWYFSEVLVDENDMEQWEIVENLIDKLQKENERLNSEINQRIKLKLENEKIGDELYRKIDKLQKENEELKEKIKEYEIGIVKE